MSMPNFPQLAFDVLEADLTLTALLTGGFHIDLDVDGLSRDNNPDVYDAISGVLLPTLVVAGREVNPITDGPRDPAPYLPVRQIIELYFYNDRAGGWLYSAKERAFELLQEKQLSGTFFVELFNDVKTRAPELSGATLLRSDYRITGFYGG